MPIEQVIYGVAVPAVLAMAGLLLARRPRRNGLRPIVPLAPIASVDTLPRVLGHAAAEPASGRARLRMPAGGIAPGCAMAVAYVLGHLLLMGRPERPLEPWHWLPVLAVAAAGLSILYVVGRVSIWPRRVLDGSLYAVALVLLLRPAPLNTWDRGRAGWWLAGLWLGLMVFTRLMHRLARRVRGATLAGVMMVAGTAGGIVLVCSSNARLGQLAGVLTAATGGAFVSGLLRPEMSFSGGGVRVTTLLLAALLVLGYFNDYTELPAMTFPLVAAAPLAAWVGQLPPIRRLRPWQRFIARIVAVLIPSAISAAIAWRAYQSVARWDEAY